MTLIFGVNSTSDFGVNWTLVIANILFFILLALALSLVLRAVKLVVRAVTAAENSAKAQQDTVYLLREIATILKSKEEKHP